ncbi:hypothetical protein [Bradyrhizobium lablabi]|uniref:hypothetical protein n=1 Tax=Bradyrhizobium lablabi TaxID=722472 RepID=UPI001BA6E9A1|nr:hypothetical protein [Bradyrhizobium lablabi]MBR0692127.1 hypothetical protein [Bradyrhizobium lablabi]
MPLWPRQVLFDVNIGIPWRGGLAATRADWVKALQHIYTVLSSIGMFQTARSCPEIMPVGRYRQSSMM